MNLDRHLAITNVLLWHYQMGEWWEIREAQRLSYPVALRVTNRTAVGVRSIVPELPMFTQRQ